MASAIRLETPFTLPNQAKLFSSCMCTAHQKEPALITIYLTSDRITLIEMPACELFDMMMGGAGTCGMLTSATAPRRRPSAALASCIHTGISATARRG